MLTTAPKALFPMARTCLLRRTAPIYARLSVFNLQAHQTATSRSFFQSTFVAYPRKDSQDKDSLQPEASENSKSGTDDAAASQEEAAFDPDQTSPQQEKDTAGKGEGVSTASFAVLHCAVILT